LGEKFLRFGLVNVSRVRQAPPWAVSLESRSGVAVNLNAKPNGESGRFQTDI
jgi:hypothetical protein